MINATKKADKTTAFFCIIQLRVTVLSKLKYSYTHMERLTYPRLSSYSSTFCRCRCSTSSSYTHYTDTSSDIPCRLLQRHHSVGCLLKSHCLCSQFLYHHIHPTKSRSYYYPNSLHNYSHSDCASKLHHTSSVQWLWSCSNHCLDHCMCILYYQSGHHSMGSWRRMPDRHRHILPLQLSAWSRGWYLYKQPANYHWSFC